MKYLTLIPTGLELRNDGSTSLPSGAIATTDEEFEGLLQGSLILENGIIKATPEPTTAQKVAAAQGEKLSSLTQAYNTAIRQPVAYTPNTTQTQWQALKNARDFAAFMRLGARTEAVHAPGVTTVEAVDLINW